MLGIYELISEIDSIRLNDHWDNLPHSFNQSNRAKLGSEIDLIVFDLIAKTYKITIIYKSDRNDNNLETEYRKCGSGGLIPFTDSELDIFNNLEWRRLPHNLKAHIYDVIWLCNHKYEAAKTAADEYYESYLEWFDELHWVQCVDYINRAIELAAKIGVDDKKELFMTKVFNDIVRLNGDDPSFLSISLIEVLVDQNYHCDFSSLIPFVEKLILKNKESVSTAHIYEQACYAKANLYKNLKDTISENNVYIQYADCLMQRAEEFVKASKGGESVDNRNWFMVENDIKKAIGLFQKHGASEKAINAQKHLIDVQKVAVMNIPMHEFKYDVSEFYKRFCDEYGKHDVHELVWDVVFAFRFQNKQKLREDVTKDSPISSIFPTQMLGADGQTESFLPGLNLDDDNNILLHMYNKAREYEIIQGQTFGVWFIQNFRKRGLTETDLDPIFENNPIIPKGQEKDVQRGVYYGLTGHMSDALDKLAPKMESIIRNLAEICGDSMTYYDTKERVQKKRVLSQVFSGKKLNDCVEENILFTFDGLLQQKTGSNIRNRVGHGINTEADCSKGDCIYFVMIVLKFCAIFCDSFIDEIERHNAFLSDQ